jgi:hypothetical protein
MYIWLVCNKYGSVKKHEKCRILRFKIIEWRQGQEMFSLLQNLQTSSLVHPFAGKWASVVIFWEYSSWGTNLTIQLHLVPRLRMSAAILLLFLLYLCGIDKDFT